MRELIQHDLELAVARNSKERIPLHVACQHGHLEVVKVFDLQSPKIFDAIDADHNTSLHFACESECVGVVKHLIEHGASIFSTNNKGEAPVHIAAQHKSVKVIEILLRDYTMIECKDQCNSTPLHHAAKHNQVEIIKFLLER